MTGCGDHREIKVKVVALITALCRWYKSTSAETAASLRRRKAHVEEMMEEYLHRQNHPFTVTLED